MPGKVIGKETGFGFAGQIARMPDEIVRTRPVSDESEVIKFGDPVVILTDGSVKRFEATSTADHFSGVAARRVKSAAVYYNQDLGQYDQGDPCDIIERGAVSVFCAVGDPQPTGAVYVRIAANAAFPNGFVGGFEAQADGGNTILLNNAKWGTIKDADNIAELVILTRQGV